MGDLLDKTGATGACGGQTAGQRIAAQLKFSWDHLSVDTTALADAIDEAIREAREEGWTAACKAHERYKQDCAAKEAEAAAMRLALRTLGRYVAVECEAAAMFMDSEEHGQRVALAYDGHIIGPTGDPKYELYEFADTVAKWLKEETDKALASNAGADLLARLRAAEMDVAEWKSKAAGAEHAVADAAATLRAAEEKAAALEAYMNPADVCAAISSARAKEPSDA